MSNILINDPLEQLESLDKATPRQVDWLWRFQLAAGKLAMLDGDPREGKSMVTLDLCARLTTGRPMPDGSPGPAPCNCLLLQSEDSFEDTVVPRLTALGADLARIFRWRLRTAADQPLRIPANLDVLERALLQCDARYLVLDPVVAFLDASVFANSDHGIRRVLAPLADLLERRRCASTMVRHLNKQGGTNALYRGGGSIGLQAACRTSWLVGHDPDNLGRRVLAQNKNNLSPLQPSLAYELHAEGDGPPTIRWLGVSQYSADQLLAAAARAAPERDRARDFLSAFLNDGPRTSHEIWDAARKQGHSDITVRRAARKIPVDFRRVFCDGVQKTYWLLPGQELSASAHAHKDNNDIWEAIAEQERRFPRPCPLDDDGTEENW